jgi:hypothetical protein
MRPPLAASAGWGRVNNRPLTSTGTASQLATRRSSRADIASKEEMAEI